MATSRATDTEPVIGWATYRFAAGDRITISVLGQSDFSDDSRWTTPATEPRW
jgi:hypothetical protein